MVGRLRIAAAAAAAAAWAALCIGQAGGATIGTIGEHGPFGGIVQALAINPNDSGVMYAGTRAGLFRTADGGGTWNRVRGLVGDWISAVAVDPTNGQVVWVQDGSHLHRSSDGGANWTDVTPKVDNWGGRIAIAPSDPNTVWSGAARTTDGGAHWARTRTDQTDGVVIDPSDSQTVLITTVNGLFRTVDGGASWAPAGTGLPVFSEINGDGQNGLVVFGTAGSTGTLYRSVDGGASFTGLTVPAGWQMVNLAAAPSDPQIVYATGRIGRDPLLARSTDGGVTWAQVGAGPVGAELAPVPAVDPVDPAHLAVGTFGYGVYTSDDSGATWSPRSIGLAATEPRSVAADPNDGAVIYSADAFTAAVSLDGGATWSDMTAGLDDAADPTAGVSPTAVAVDGASIVYASRAPDSNPAQWDPVMRSTDHGATWQPASHGIPAGLDVPRLLADPSRSGVVFADAGSSYFGPTGNLYLTDDGGESWRAVGPANLMPTAMAFDDHTQTLVIAAGRKVWVTTDDGGHWHARTSLPSGFPADALAIGATPDTLYAGNMAANHVAVSRDGGATWSVVTLDRTNHASSVLALAVDPGDPASVWAGTDEGGLFVSRDAGDTWSQVNHGVEGRSVGALATTVDTGLATQQVHPLFLGRSGGKSNGVARLIPAPRNVRRPSIRGAMTVGNTVACARGHWRNAVRFSVRWYRDGRRLASHRRTRLIRLDDRGHRLSCGVVARGPGGTRTAHSRAGTVI